MELPEDKGSRKEGIFFFFYAEEYVLILTNNPFMAFNQFDYSFAYIISMLNTRKVVHAANQIIVIIITVINNIIIILKR